VIRIIPRLDIKGNNLVKGIHLEGLRVLGDPSYFAKLYYEQQADELLLVDVVASLYGRNSLYEIIKKTAAEIFIPITVGGGIRTLDDVKNMLRAGADRVALNSAALQNPELIRQIADTFGSSTVVGAVEAVNVDGIYHATYDNGREDSGKDVVSWVQELTHLGVGEIALTSVDCEGTGKGFDLTLLASVQQSTDVSLILHGGANSLENAALASKQIGTGGISLASMFHYGTPAVMENPEIQKKSNIEVTNIINLKEYLKGSGIECRS
jgi:cyclase